MRNARFTRAWGVPPALLATGVGVVLCSFSLASVAAAAACPNEAFRVGYSAQLPDCRAYELVTPADSHGRTFGVLPKEGHDLFRTELAGSSGGSFIFSTHTAGPLQSPLGANGQQELDGYESQREQSGWVVARRVTPSGAEAVLPAVGGLSPDHEYTFVFVRPEYPQPGPATNYGSLFQFDPSYNWGGADYLGDSEGHFEFTGVGSLGIEKLAQGRYISANGEHVIFSTGKEPSGSEWCSIAATLSFPCPVRKLEPKAPPEGTGTVYDRSANGSTHVVSLLPGDIPPAAGEDAAYQGASASGAVVAFKVGGVLYVRVDNATTAKVTEAPATFGGFSEDGQYLFYVAAGNIHRFDTASKVDTAVNSSGDGQIVNVSADGSHVYFISEQQLDGPNGVSGQPNMYVWTGGSPKYITTVSAGDVLGLGRWTAVVAPGSESGPGLDLSRTTPGGGAIIFAAQAQLTPYENKGHTEIYRYDDEAEILTCVSCNPEGMPASTDARLEDREVLHPMNVIHNLSEDGSQVFFETSESLVEFDEDEVNDIYEWQLPEGGGVPEIHLISSGQSAKFRELGANDPNVLLSITSDGRNVFFRSQDALTPEAGAGGVQAIYDARVGGGFSKSPTTSPCVEEACRPSVNTPPHVGAAASPFLHGFGNVVLAKKRVKHRHCHRKKYRKRCGRHHAQRSASGSQGILVPAEGGRDSTQTPRTASPVWAATVPGDGPSTSAAPLLSNAEFGYFGIKSVAAATSTASAGQHPDVMTDLVLNPAPGPIGSARTEDVTVDLPPGVVGNPNLVPRCEIGKFIARECSVDSEIGLGRAKLAGSEQLSPLFNLRPPHPQTEVARFGLLFLLFPVFIDVSVRTGGDYGVTATAHDALGAETLEESEVIVWGNPSDPSHDELRMTSQEVLECGGTACKAPGGKRPSTLDQIAFLTNPSACQQGQVDFTVTSYQLPGQSFSKSAQLPPITDCQGLPFAPTFEAHPTSHAAGAPTGLKTSFHLSQTTDPSLPSTATMREARVTLPQGMAINTSAADGLAACTDDQVHFHHEQDAQCPDASKLGTATLTSPALPHPLQGALYQRSQGDKGHRFRLWLVSDDLGLHIKIPGEIHPDPASGQLTAVFADLPQVPVEGIDFDVWGGPRAPLKNPDSCGTYQTSFSFQPHSNDPAVTGTTPMAINEGCGARGFSPQLHGGATKPRAGHFSPFVLDLARSDGEQDLAGFEVTLPKGELAKLKGVALCPNDLAPSGACPEGSKVGSVIAAAGAGPFPLWIPQPGKAPTAVYLAGPYKGAPYSIVSVVPAQAGPFDLGNVVVRSALEVEPETGIATVKTDPLPQLIEGVPVLYRRLHVTVDRRHFTLNPTDCSELAITSNITSTTGAVAHPSERFQVDGCRKLGFKPKLSLELKGGTERGDYPALSATLKARKGDANLGAVSVALPHSEFLAQEHIITICTRKQFDANKCPKGSVYGHAKAFTPLLSKPLSGPVYLRSNPAHELPDLVIDLKGQIEIVVAARIDQAHQGIRTNFEAIPDAPISRFVLEMRGGKKSLLVNSTDLCAGRHRATVRMRAQNGRRIDARPVLGVGCGR